MSETELESKFTGGLIGWIWVNTLFYASIIFTAGILMPFALCYRERWLARHTILSGKQLEFYGSSIVLFLRKILILIFGPILIGLAVGLFFALFGSYLGNDYDGPSIFGMALVPLVTAILFALFTAWIARRMRKWIIKHTRLIEIE